MPQLTLRALIALLVLAPMTAVAQAGSIVGQVTDAATGRPVANARIEATAVTGARVSQPVVRADESGNYRIPNLDAGTYSVLARQIGYQAKQLTAVEVSAGVATRADITLNEDIRQLAEVITTASRRDEKVLDAPATVAVVTLQQVQEKPNVTITDHVRDLPGVDVASGGLMQANIVARGFNNIFSGSMLMLTDNRFAFVPSLRVNVPYFLPEINEDIERIEVVLGPGAALYGPNTAGGVLHMITRSPFASQGTTLTIDAGQQDLLRGAFRTAWAPTDKFGVKLSYQYFRAEEFPTAPLDFDSAEVVARDLRLRRAGGQVRFDFRPWEDTEIIANYGRSVAMNAVEPTGLGAGQVKDWTYDTWQLRARRGQLFGQFFLNRSDAGETFLLRTLQPIVDNSTQWVGQLQHGRRFAGTELLYGLDYQHTTPKTGGTINGRNEDDDKITEVGGYLHSTTQISRLFEFVAAARVDKHNRVDDAVFSPRAALVFKPSQTQNVRLTYNRAFSQPSTNNLFLDLKAGAIPSGIPNVDLYGVRALGVPSAGLAFGTCAGGFSDLCMRVPPLFAGFSGGAIPPDALIPAHASTLYRIAVEVARPSLIAGGMPEGLVDYMASLQPTPAQVSTQLRVLNPTQGIFTDVAPTDLRDIPAIVPSISQTWEIGHKGIYFNRLQFVWDVWRERKTNFVGPLIVETPNVFLERESLAAFLTAAFTAANVPDPQQRAAQVSAALAGISGSASAQTRGIPLGVVNFDHTLSSASDIVLTYRNFGRLNVWGADAGTELLLDHGLSFGGTYAYVNKDFFSREEIGGVSDIALNAPRTKAAIFGRYRSDWTGIGVELKARHVSAFPVISGVWADPPGQARISCDDQPRATCVETYRVMDAGISWRPSMLDGALWSLYAYNVLDKKHKQFAGGAQLGRLIMTRVQYTFR